ncbi:AAA family ATPase [Candidatus Woesearchaeota archaeon]|nr:AAA family ATPase [Candidatus Woesearchaeota archaeon]
MPLFKDLLKSGESIFRDTIVLDYDYQPKVVPYRENEQMRLATVVRPLLQGYNGRNLFVYGPPGIGKTTACKHVLRELEDESGETLPIYINCWKDNTTYKIFYRICEDLGFKFLQAKRTNELFALIKGSLNKKPVVLVFDELDKLEDTDFLYSILEDIYRKSIIVLTNYRDYYSELDERIRSRLSPEFLFFRPYNESEITGILIQRREYAFVPGVWDEDTFKELVEKCVETKDLRIGLYLMREAGNIAEERSSKVISAVHLAEALKKVEDFHIKPKEGLDEELQLILELVKEHAGKKIGDIYAAYAEMGGEISYKSFQRRIIKLQEGKFISTEKVSGKEGNTTIVNLSNEKKLTEF